MRFTIFFACCLLLILAAGGCAPAPEENKADAQTAKEQPTQTQTAQTTQTTDLAPGQTTDQTTGQPIVQVVAPQPGAAAQSSPKHDGPALKILFSADGNGEYAPCPT